MELFRIYLRLLPVLNVKARCNHARQKVKQALVYSREQTANFPSAFRKNIGPFPSDFFSLSCKNIQHPKEIETVEATEHFEARAAWQPPPRLLSAFLPVLPGRLSCSAWCPLP